MNKTLIQDKDDFNYWKDEEIVKKSYYRDRIIRPVGYPDVPPTFYPCLIVWDVSEDSNSRVWIDYEYIYPSDFQRTGK